MSEPEKEADALDGFGGRDGFGGHAHLDHPGHLNHPEHSDRLGHLNRLEHSDRLERLDRRCWLVGGGEMGKLVRSIDWDRSPLGPIEGWPQSLKTTVSLCLASVSPFSIIWGPQHIQIYNDGYWPICGTKHPASTGQDYRECWASAWPVIGEGFEAALRGETRYFENQWMYLDRYGYLEETCFTFSFSPIWDESGGIGGLLHPVTEVTAALVSERRLRAIRDVISRASAAHSVDSAMVLSTAVLSECRLDVPFALLYRASGAEARLVAATAGVSDRIAPGKIALHASRDATDRGNDSGGSFTELQRSRLGRPELGRPELGWPLQEAMSSNRLVEVSDLAGRFGAFECSPYPEPPRTALLLPISLPGEESPTVVLVAGVSARLPLNAVYRDFYDLLAGGISSALTRAHSYEEECGRAEKLAEIDRAKTVFFSNVSHEFRTPLTLILGPIEDELAEKKGPLPAERRERLETAHRNAMRLLKLVNTLLDFSRIEAGRIGACFEATDLAVYTAELASNFRSAVEKGGLALEVSCEPLPELIFVDRTMWEKVVLNLLSNAFKHTFEGSIGISLTWLDQEVELAVKDTGIGIAASELPHLFERFRRVPNARSRTHEGTGIGLALISELIEAHGGRVRVDSEEGRGSTFFVTVKTGRAHLPAESVDERIREADGAKSPHGIEARVLTEEALRWRPDEVEPESDGVSGAEGELIAPLARILWADDSSDMRRYVKRLLSAKYSVVAVADGLEAVREATENPPDLILTDVMMPGLDGFGVLRAIRKDERTKLVPVIILSARAGEEESVEGMEAGADDYLMKPFSARELLARIGAQLRAAGLRKEWAERLEARERTLVLTAKELKRSNEDLKHFAHIASHDLQEPLRTVTSYLQLLSRRYQGRLDTDADDFIGFAVDACKRMKELIQDLLDYSRVGVAAGTTTLAPVEEIVQRALSNLRLVIGESETTVICEALPTIDTNVAQLAQVFQNLIGNAIKYRGAEYPRIHIAGLRGEEGEWIFSVRDNGMGIDPRYFEKIFVLFQRVTQESGIAGTGLGLAICKKIVERLGGRIWVESEVGVGSTFYFSLPAEG